MKSGQIDIGERFTKLLVISRVSKTTFKCRCDCGKEVVVTFAGLKFKNNQSCGCLRNIRAHDWNDQGFRLTRAKQSGAKGKIPSNANQLIEEFLRNKKGK